MGSSLGGDDPKAGLLTCGPAYLLEQRERDGSSMRRVAVSDIRQLPSTGITQGQRCGAGGSAFSNCPLIRCPSSPACTQPAPRSTPSGSPRRREGRSAPTSTCVRASTTCWIRTSPGIVIGASFSDDPGTANAVFGNEQVAWVTLPKEIDRVAGQGLLRDLGSHAQHGMQIAVAELI